ncbi:CADD family putative folate metabolism protein [Candidatus Woesearchaeota archaeon]|nr:CADD family putative folate metabolism protein [Candidatus Woesearchaeota archaeon]
MPFIQQLKNEIDQKHLLKHPFYQMWEKGTLPLSVMQRYAEQYYHLEKSFPVFLSLMHSNCEDFAVRQAITDNLYDEEHGKENHRELWLQFGEQIGAKRNEMMECALLPETQKTIITFKNLSKKSWLSGSAALAAYESQIPVIAQKKIEGLQKHYGIVKSPSFFVLHEKLDVDHTNTWWNIIEQHAGTPEKKQEVLNAVKEGRDALWQFLDGICREYLPGQMLTC